MRRGAAWIENDAVNVAATVSARWWPARFDCCPRDASEEACRRVFSEESRAVAAARAPFPPPKHESCRLPPGPYDVVYADPPWFYYGSQIKDAAAAKHYPLMTLDDLARLPVRQ